jgi:cellulose synthase/poly-beta-1,6-N-acetylglucosamine synthase-like glycosyltransferase
MILGIQAIFWFSVGAVVYAYALYPVLIFLFSRLFGQKPQAPSLTDKELPKVSLLVAALNEEQVIEERIQNALDLDYPTERLEIVIASDGSTDRTAELVTRYERENPGRVRLLNYPQRRGKAMVLNVSVPHLNGDVVLLSDANTFFDRAAAKNLVRWFSDAKVGVVCGKLKLVSPQTGKNVDSLYWRYETFLKECEGRLGALLGSNGAIYAFRREDYVPIATDTIIDDFMIPLLIKLQRGKRIVYDPEAVAHEETPPDIGSEFGRRSRIGAGGFQSLVRLKRLLLPTYGWTSFAFWSHKLLRWSCPVFLLLALGANLLLIGNGWYQVILLLQALFYLVAYAGSFIPGNGIAARLVRLTTMFTSMNLALACGFWRWIAGLQGGTWQRTARAPVEASR